MSEPAVPPHLARNVVLVWGERGRRWLTELPALRDAVAQAWQLRLRAPYPLSYHWVAPATAADGTPVVVKLGVPGAEHLTAEAAALEAFGGRGAVRLLATDLGRGALLLERARPGTQARDLVRARDDQATAALVAAMRRLHVPPPPGCRLPPLSGYAASFADYLRTHPTDWPLPRAVVERAGRLFDELCASAPRPVLLHGDLHHDNLLRAEREPWLAIDPHGLVGDPGFDVGALLYNPAPDDRDDDLLALVPARVEQLADGLGIPVDRVRAWGYAAAVLSEVWTVEDGGPARTRALDVALRLLPTLS
ncbi:MAG TPA: aminoglycoside phosphotransferase family protein [Micromonosporaceae bacterium]|nr:aminoglycoside phosphotransferase family protein [Micromonosporaceae bacterium]